MHGLHGAQWHRQDHELQARHGLQGLRHAHTTACHHGVVCALRVAVSTPHTPPNPHSHTPSLNVGLHHGCPGTYTFGSVWRFMQADKNAPSTHPRHGCTQRGNPTCHAYNHMTDTSLAIWAKFLQVPQQGQQVPAEVRWLLPLVLHAQGRNNHQHLVERPAGLLFGSHVVVPVERARACARVCVWCACACARACA